MAIGIHNADVVEGPFKYIATPKDANAFVPLEKDSEMTPEEILTEHDKGKAYAHLIEDFDKYLRSNELLKKNFKITEKTDKKDVTNSHL